MSDLRAILDREFRDAVIEEAAQTTNQKDKAKFLGFSESNFSRILRGETRLTDKKILHIARRFRGSGARADELTLELRKAARRIIDASEPRATGASVDNVAQLFKRLGTPGAFLCVEYRDMPRAGPEAKYRDYALDAGRAIARGLHFAMFQPFGCSRQSEEKTGSTEEKERHTLAVRAYIQQLRGRIREVYQSMLNAARMESERIGSTHDVERRIVLYERDTDRFIGSGIQTRLFYAEIPTDTHVEHEVWEWIAARGRDLFVERDPDSTPREVIAQQFFPITKYWHVNDKLPTTSSELNSALKLGGTLDVHLERCPWLVFGEDNCDEAP